MSADVIPLVRVKLLERGELAPRLRPVEKAPPKGLELRMSRPPSRLAGREVDGVGLLGALKLPHRPRRAPKMRMFRSFKLFTGMKRQPIVSPLVSRRRPIGKFG